MGFISSFTAQLLEFGRVDGGASLLGHIVRLCLDFPSAESCTIHDPQLIAGDKERLLSAEIATLDDAGNISISPSVCLAIREHAERIQWGDQMKYNRSMFCLDSLERDPQILAILRKIEEQCLPQSDGSIQFHADFVGHGHAQALAQIGFATIEHSGDLSIQWIDRVALRMYLSRVR